MSNINDEFEFAPVVIHTYTRLEHLKKTIEALLCNNLAPFTDLFVASDAPKEKKDEEAVFLVREYIQSIKGFKSINVILRDKNYGFHLNAVMAFNEIFKRVDRLITMEDDIVVGQGFLQYVNDGLRIYENDKDVYAICGYLHKSISIKHSGNAILLKGYSPWGYGIWRDRYLEAPDAVIIANKFLKNPYLFVKMNLNRPDLVLGLLKLAKRKVIAVDLGVLLHMIEKNKKCLFPTKSLVRNIGNDGSGIHCVEDNAYQNQTYNQNRMIFIEENKDLHNFSHNLFFSSLGGWTLLINNLFKFLLIISMGEYNYEKIRKMRNRLLKK